MGLCSAGFHFCKNLKDCFEYYSFNPENKVAEIEVLGEVEHGDDKSVTNKIRIIRELTWHEVLDLVNLGRGNTGLSNSGDSNSGHYNSGNRNSGHYNSGNYNSGNRNSGHYNSGNRNSGNRNSGHYNSGNRNSGHYNSGDSNSGHYNSGDSNSGHYNSGNRNSGNRNSGHYNSGDFNSCNYSSGVFCSVEPEFLLFNKPSSISRDEFRCSEAGYISRRLRVTDDEGNPIDYKQAWSRLWESLSNSEKITVQSIPNFDADVFEEITGIRV
ncbi:hypothetical protein NST85_29060 [Paenibacillus sp. FSL K6-2524]|uniref:DUF7666 domain-containing protein n=1 Tax=Paenibacillus sp. FSL K6-2524 TaxID=2954516 RepID=UPI0030F9E0BE